MSIWDEPDFSPSFSSPTERKVPRIPTLAEQREQIAKRCAERDAWQPTIICGRKVMVFAGIFGHRKTAP